MKNNDFGFFMSGFIPVLILIFFLGCSGKSQDKPSIPWNEYFLQGRELAGKNPDANYIRNTKFWVTIKPDQNLTMKAVIEAMGEPKETEKVVVREEREDRAEILKLHKYNGLIFVESDLSAKPGTVEKILLKRK